MTTTLYGSERAIVTFNDFPLNQNVNTNDVFAVYKTAEGVDRKVTVQSLLDYLSRKAVPQVEVQRVELSTANDGAILQINAVSPWVIVTSDVFLNIPGIELTLPASDDKAEVVLSLSNEFNVSGVASVSAVDAGGSPLTVVPDSISIAAPLGLKFRYDAETTSWNFVGRV